MSDQPRPETPERDSWRKVALGFNELHTNGRLSSLSDVEDRIVDLTARVDALLAVEDKHPPADVEQLIEERDWWKTAYEKAESICVRCGRELDALNTDPGDLAARDEHPSVRKAFEAAIRSAIAEALAVYETETERGISPGPARRAAAATAVGGALAAYKASRDKHPPVFHIRPVKRRKKLRAADAYYPRTEYRTRTEWRWVAERNGRKLYGSTESYEHRQHAIDQAHDVADVLGARVLDKEGNEV